MATELENGKVLCEQCGDDFEMIGIHWSKGKTCSHPELSTQKKEILTGILMGDGSVGHKSRKNQRIQVKMISPNYLEYINNQLGWLSTGATFHKSAKEKAKENRNSGFSPNAKEENYSDQYRLTTRAHPFITSLREWYSSGSKVWPEDIELTPTVLKHWYCGDGHYSNDDSHNRIQIAMSNEVDNREKISSYFSNVGLPKPSNYSIWERKDGGKCCNACWKREDSYKLWDYMGEPLPDFAYKWPEEFR